MSERHATPLCDALARNALDSNDISAWYSLAYSLEKKLSVALSESAPIAAAAYVLAIQQCVGSILSQYAANKILDRAKEIANGH